MSTSNTKKICMADKVDNWREPTNTKSFRAFHFKKRKRVEQKQVHQGPWYPADYKFNRHTCGICNARIKSPQQVYCCLTPYCEECIHKHYNVLRKLKCPSCDKYLSPNDDPDICMSCGYYRCKCSSYDDYDEHDGPYDDDPYDHDDEYEDDGTLGCGCIDVCRGRCGSDW